MAGSEIKGSILNRETGCNLAKHANRIRYADERRSFVPGATQCLSNPVVQSPDKFLRSRSFGKPQTFLKKNKSISLQIRHESDDLTQYERTSQLDKAKSRITGSFHDAAQLFRVKPLIPGPGEEELQFDLNPR